MNDYNNFFQVMRQETDFSIVLVLDRKGTLTFSPYPKIKGQEALIIKQLIVLYSILFLLPFCKSLSLSAFLV